jgi:predicted Na+-dependent transporter
MLQRLTRVPVDTFLLALFPATDTYAAVLDVATKVAIGLLFLLYGTRLSPTEAFHGLKHWRLVEHARRGADAAARGRVVGVTVGVSRLARLNRADTAVVLFCGSKKSLASGLPMALVFFGTGAWT